MLKTRRSTKVGKGNRFQILKPRIHKIQPCGNFIQEILPIELGTWKNHCAHSSKETQPWLGQVNLWDQFQTTITKWKTIVASILKVSCSPHMWNGHACKEKWGTFSDDFKCIFNYMNNTNKEYKSMNTHNRIALHCIYHLNLAKECTKWWKNCWVSTASHERSHEWPRQCLQNKRFDTNKFDQVPQW